MIAFDKLWSVLLIPCLAFAVGGCGGEADDGASGASADGGAGNGGKVVLQVEGSDTMVNLAQAWAERYSEKNSGVQVQVSGGGSGVGIASLINGVVDIANASRRMKDKEIALMKDSTGKEPVEFVVGQDALAIYVHKANPIESISIAELADIYGDGGTTTTWGQLGVENTGCNSGEITRVSRQNNSGTYVYFREAVLDKNDFKLGSIDQSGSKDVVSLVSTTPCAIGYSGMGYATDEVRMVPVARVKGEAGVAPTVENAASGAYPIARPLLIYTAGEPTGAVKEYLDWIMSAEGQQIVLEMGYVPVGETEAATVDAAPKAGDATAEEQPTAEGAAEAAGSSN
jgi:phosphate transport system substrate-binding protein